MDETTKLVANYFKCNNIHVPPHRIKFLQQFIEIKENRALIDAMVENGSRLMAKWNHTERIAEIMEQSFRVPNATVGKPYEATVNTDQWSDVSVLNVAGVEEVGLYYDPQKRQIEGIPTKSGDIKISLQFKIGGEEEEQVYEKPLVLVINPDPKTLWKRIESNKEDPHWKEDNVTLFSPLCGRHILISSKRGRSHANIGSFREDDFRFTELDNGWCIVVVSDGAGSAPFSRKGSALACEETVNFFKDPAGVEIMSGFDPMLLEYAATRSRETENNLNRFIYNTLGKAVFTVHKKLETFAKNNALGLKELSATLIFCLYKKFDVGYAFLSFGVGDCPIAILNKEITEVKLMNWLDVGEYGGGTRFITMPEIFVSEKFASRFSFKLLDDFSYLFLMSDGIYDPKFVVESALPNIEKWREFLADLAGNNADGIKVELSAGNNNIEQQFAEWMDFWSPGNHDDRTLAIVF